MNNIILHNQITNTYTQISNIFIDEYMPSANGSYVKVYLLLLRTLSGYNSSISIPNIADSLELTDSDVKRAFVYWEKHDLLNIVRNSKGVISDISITSPDAIKVKSNFNVVINTAATLEESNINNDKTSYNRTYSSAEIKKVSTQTDFEWIITIIEKYMERTLTPSDVETAVFIYDSLHFSSDLMFYLYEYCISRGKKSAKYIQTVAINWDKEGIDTVDKADQFSARFEVNYIDVMKTFGLNGIPAPAQKEYIDKWLSSGFEPEIIKEACSRTLIAINEPSFKYANGILDNWKKLNVKTLADISKADSERATKVMAAHTDSLERTKPARKNSFNSYSQRNYSRDDYSSIEQQLLSN